MANEILLLRKGTTGSTGLATLSAGELAVNYADGQLFTFKTGQSDNTLIGTEFGAFGVSMAAAANSAAATALLDNFSTTLTTAGLVPGSNNVGATFFLAADGTWAVPPGSGGLDNIVEDLTPQLGGNLDTNLFDITAGPPANATADGKDLDLIGGDGGATSGDGGGVNINSGAGDSGGDIVLTAAPAGSTSFPGGDIRLLGGAAIDGVGAGGEISLTGGDAGTLGAGGVVQMTAGNGGSTSGSGGWATIRAGDAQAGNSDGGDIFLSPGEGIGTGSDGAIRIGQQNTGAPTVTTDKMYNLAGSLYWNGVDLTAPGGLQNVVEDLTPQLGGNLDVNQFNIVNGEDDGIYLVGTTATASFAAGFIELTAGNGSTFDDGGEVLIQSGGAGNGQDAGNVVITAGDGTGVTSDGGNVLITGGRFGKNNGVEQGTVTLTGGGFTGITAGNMIRIAGVENDGGTDIGSLRIYGEANGNSGANQQGGGSIDILSAKSNFVGGESGDVNLTASDQTTTGGTPGQVLIQGGSGITAGAVASQPIEMNPGRNTTTGAYNNVQVKPRFPNDTPFGMPGLEFVSGQNTNPGISVTLKVPHTQTVSRTWTLPVDDPSVVSGQYLTTDASGNLSFAAVTGGTFDRPTSVESGATVFSDIVVLDGLVTGIATRELTPADISALALSGGTMTGALILNDDPSAALGAVTKQYADALIQGVSVKDSVRVATNAVLPAYTQSGSGATGTITMDAVGIVTVDGEDLTAANGFVVGDRVLVKHGTGADQGIYDITVLSAAGAALVMVRSPDANIGAEMQSAYVFVDSGTALSDTSWLQTSDITTIDTDAQTWSQFSSAGLHTASSVGTTYHIWKQKNGNDEEFRGVLNATNGGLALSTTATDITFALDVDDVTTDAAVDGATDHVLYSNGGVTRKALLNDMLDGGTWS